MKTIIFYCFKRTIFKKMEEKKKSEIEPSSWKKKEPLKAKGLIL